MKRGYAGESGRLALPRSPKPRRRKPLQLDLLAPFDHVWNWRKNAMRTVDRKGELCRVLARGARNSVLVEFEDGFKVITSRYAVRRNCGRPRDLSKRTS